MARQRQTQSSQDVPYAPFREKKKRGALRIDKRKPQYEQVVQLNDGTRILRPTDSNLGSQVVNIASRNEILRATAMKNIQLERERMEAHLVNLPDMIQKAAGQQYIRNLNANQQKLASEGLPLGLAAAFTVPGAAPMIARPGGASQNMNPHAAYWASSLHLGATPSGRASSITSWAQPRTPRRLRPARSVPED